MRVSTTARRGAIAAAVAVVVALAGGCTGGDDEPEEPAESGTTSPAAPPLETKITFGEIAGKLPAKRRASLKGQVADVVDGWLDRAYVAGDYPRTSFDDAFRGFTKDAAALAEKQRDLLTNAGIGNRIEGVTATRRVVVLDVLAVKGRPKGVTARVRLVFKTTGDVQRTEQVLARLALTPAAKGWRVFAFDVRRGEVRGGAGKQDRGTTDRRRKDRASDDKRQKSSKRDGRGDRRRDER